MQQEHTPEPWNITISGCKITDGNKTVAFCDKTKDAKRIVECVNAMAGIEKPEAFMEVVTKLKLDAYPMLLEKTEAAYSTINELKAEIENLKNAQK